MDIFFIFTYNNNVRLILVVLRKILGQFSVNFYFIGFLFFNQKSLCALLGYLLVGVSVNCMDVGAFMYHNLYG